MILSTAREGRMDLLKWEYLNYLGSGARGPLDEEVTPSGGVLYHTEEVDELGEQGWELVWVDNSGNRPHYYFRRPKQ
jgi:hypothetical protein